MPKKILAIATCRVSSTEQLDSNSLNRQAKSVAEAAKYLNATIPSDGIWSGSVSSKEGRNYSRKDLRAMLDYCKKNSAVKYLIVDEIDRFMRSIDEMFYFEVEFRNKVGVKVWYAGDPALNSDDPLTKLRRAMEAFKAEGSNLERQIKSIKGQTAAIKEGRYPFSPKPGYRRGYEKGIQEIDIVRGPILKKALITVALRLKTPSQALVELNKSEFVVGHSLYKMDKFRKILTDPFYAGIVQMDKQVKARNENGLHKALITKDQHYELLRIMDGKLKNQSGPRKNGNPEYPLSNLIACDDCADKPNGRLVGFNHGNGKSKALVYKKYRCRSCGKYQHRNDLHSAIENQFKDRPITQDGLDDFIAALDIVWEQQEGQVSQDINHMQHKINILQQEIARQVEAATDPSNLSIKEDILAIVARKKIQISDLEDELTNLTSDKNTDREKFLRFAFNFIENTGSQFLDPYVVSPENRIRCKQLIFPAGFHVDANNKVYTPEISELYRLASNKKDLPKPEKSLLVRVKRL
jgi:DNA invertase Pin-like site-specific DNA recombinase